MKLGLLDPTRAVLPLQQQQQQGGPTPATSGSGLSLDEGDVRRLLGLREALLAGGKITYCELNTQHDRLILRQMSKAKVPVIKAEAFLVYLQDGGGGNHASVSCDSSAFRKVIAAELKNLGEEEGEGEEET
jgi:hypothetical protein